MQETSNTNLHVKVQCNNEFRRFVLSEITYNQLAETIRSLLGLATESPYTLSYLDDEKDWVVFATDSELQYAISLCNSQTPLKINVKLPSSTPQTPPSSPVVPSSLPLSPYSHPCPWPCPPGGESEEGADRPWRWGGGGRGGRGGRGRGGSRGGSRGGRRVESATTKTERVNAKIARLTDRHVSLTAKLVEEDLPQEKARALEWRLSHLQNKIDSLKAKKEFLDSSVTKQENQTSEEPSSPEKTDNNDEESDDEEYEEDDKQARPWRRGGWGHGPHGYHQGFGGHHHGYHHGHHHGYEHGGRRGRGGPHCRFEEGEHGEFPPPCPPCPPGYGGEHPSPPPYSFPPGEHHRHGDRSDRGGWEKKGDRGGRGGKTKSFVHACSIPEGKAAFDRVHAAKEAVVAARRDKAEKEVVAAKMEELKEAKAAWRAIKLALWKEQRGQQAK